MRTILLLFCLAFGVVSIAWGTLGILETRAFLADAVSAKGVVVSVARHDSNPSRQIGVPSSQRPWKVRAPTFEFADREGRAHRVTGHQGGYEVGEELTVLYSPRDPDLAVIDSLREVWGENLAMLGWGLLFTAGSVFALIGPDRKRIDPPSRFQ